MRYAKHYNAEDYGISKLLKSALKRTRTWRKHYGPAVFLIPLGFAIEFFAVFLMGTLPPHRFFGLSILSAACLSLGLHVKRSRRNPLWEMH